MRAGDEQGEAAGPGLIKASEVLPLGLLLVALHTAFRAWALLPSWFYADDFRLLGQANESGLDGDYLVTPFDSQFMPLGRLIAWWVADDGAANWQRAALISLILVALAALACLWLLVTAFGRRWQVLVLLALYLTTTLVLPATMWWAASLNQLPLQACWFAVLAAWLHYLRDRRFRWLAITLLLLAVGMCAYVKALAIVPLLAFVALAYFAQGSIRQRVLHVLRRHAAAVGLGLGLTAAFTLYYLSIAPSPRTEGSVRDVAAEVADRMLGTSWATAAVGGPWHWIDSNAPIGITAPPDWAVSLAWVLLAATAAYGALRRARTGRAWGLLALSLGMSYLLLLFTRAPAFGAISGNELRYLTDTAGAGVLALGLVFLPLVGAHESSRARRSPGLTWSFATPTALVLVTVIALGGVISSIRYVSIWHDDNPGEAYLRSVAAQVTGLGRVDLADATVPPTVVTPLNTPYNTLGNLLPLFTSRAHFPTTSNALYAVTEQGSVVPAVIGGGITSLPGPREDCGWRVQSEGRTIALEGLTFDFDWWVRVGYLSSQRTPVTVTAGDVVRETVLNPGIGSLFVKATGSFDEVTIDGLATDTTLCVDLIEVGEAAPGFTS